MVHCVNCFVSVIRSVCDSLTVYFGADVSRSVKVAVTVLPDEAVCYACVCACIYVFVILVWKAILLLRCFGVMDFVRALVSVLPRLVACRVLMSIRLAIEWMILWISECLCLYGSAIL